MAFMINCATDWTFDMFMEDMAKYKATPRKGVHVRRDASERESFAVWFKNAARDFEAEWFKTHKYRFDGEWIGDAFARELDGMCFSDFYKDTYGQRPHLARWFYVHALGFQQTGDVARTFCAEPVEDAVESARETRAAMERRWA